MIEHWKRADTDIRRMIVVTELLECWHKRPYQRLGQLIVNALRTKDEFLGTNLFFIEDTDLVNMITKFANNTSKEK